MITEAGYEEVGIIVDILNEAYRSGFGWTSEKGLVSGDRATKDVIISEITAGYKYYLYKYQGNYVGCFNLYLHENAIEIGGLAIKPKYQGTGLGVLLLKQAESISFSNMNSRKVIVSVLEPRVELIKFYERYGYCSSNKKYPFPVDRGVGEPLVENLQVVVFEKNA